MTPIEVLKGARALIKDPAHWYKGGWIPSDPYEPDLDEIEAAECMCVHSAMALTAEVYPGDVCRAESPTWRADREIVKTLRGLCLNDHPFKGNVPAFNDDPRTTHSDMLQVLDVTIARLEAEARKAVAA